MSEEEKIGDMLIKTVDKTWSRAIDAFVAELEKECIDERGKGDDMDKMIYLGKIRETAKRMKGEGS